MLESALTQSIDQIAETTGKTRKSLFTFLRSRGITTSTHPNLCDVRTDQFVNVTTREVAYLLGFIWADGTIRDNVIVVDCVADDMNVLEPVFDATGKWRKTEMNRLNKRPSRIFRAYNPTLCEYLGSKGYREKSLRSPVAILESIPQALRSYFWRGYFDGDGCVYRAPNGTTKVSIAGGYNQDWTAIKQLGETLDIAISINRRIQSKTSQSSCALIMTSHHIVTFLEWIYRGFETDRIGLSRKHAKYLESARHIASRPVANTGFIGVTRVKSGRFIAQLGVGSKEMKKIHYLGTFDTAEEAAKAYDEAAIKLRGSTVRTNFPAQSRDFE